MVRIGLACAVMAFGSFAKAAEPLPVTIPGLHADGKALAGFLQAPSGRSGKSPAIVLMHGCGGAVSRSGRIRQRERAWMERLTQAGYAALLIDSFTPRGVVSTCGRPTKGVSSLDDRPFDAYAALAWLRSRSDIDGSRIALMGWSHGGESVLSAVSRANVAALGGASGKFALAIAFYPGCRRLLKTNYQFGMPLLMHIGQADDWTPARYCEALAKKAGASAASLQFHMYAGAYHGFDQPRGVVRERRLPSGRVVHNGAHPQARDLAIRRTMEALAPPLAK